VNARTKAALGYKHYRGWNPLPVRPDKRPAWHVLQSARGTNAVSSFRDEPATYAELREFFESDPNVGVAIIVEAGHAVYDVDDVDADDVLDIPRTFTVGTRRGRHHHLRTDAPIRHVTFDHGELRCAGDIVVMPPTPGYRVDVDAELAELPETRRRSLRRPGSTSPRTSRTRCAST
jgi:hypothetical protein